MMPDAAFSTVLATLSETHPAPPPEGRVDWRAAIDCAVREGVFYPFYRRLAGLDKAGRCLSAAEHDHAKELYNLHLGRSAVFSAKAELALVRLEAAKIPLILIKGPAVDRLIYDGYMRPRLDIDVVVSSAGAVACREALARAGYVAGPDAADGAAVFMHRTPGEIPIHLHRRLINNTFLTVDGHLRLHEDAVWDETSPFDGYRFIRSLSPELNLLYLCEHAIKHDVDELVFLYEIDRLLRRAAAEPRFSPQRFTTFAREAGLERPAYHALALAAGLLDSPVPAAALEELRPRRLSAGERSFLRAVAARRQARYASFAVYLAARPTPVRKARFVWGMFLRRIGLAKDR